jgi:hypothetical protein
MLRALLDVGHDAITTLPCCVHYLKQDTMLSPATMLRALLDVGHDAVTRLPVMHLWLSSTSLVTSLPEACSSSSSKSV